MEVAFSLSSPFPRKYSDNNFGQLPPPPHPHFSDLRGHQCRQERTIGECCCRIKTYSEVDFLKVWVSIKFLSAKFGFTPPPRKGPKLRKNCTNQYKILKLTLFPGGGGGARFYGQNDFMDVWAFLKFPEGRSDLQAILLRNFPILLQRDLFCDGSCPLTQKHYLRKIALKCLFLQKARISRVFFFWVFLSFFPGDSESSESKLCCKTMCCASRFCSGGRGAGASRSKNLLEGAVKQMLVRGHNLRLLRAAGSRGTRGAPGTRKPGQSAQAESTQGVRWQSPYTGVSTPPSPEIPQKSQKGVPAFPGPECQKVLKMSPNTDFVV